MNPFYLLPTNKQHRPFVSVGTYLGVRLPCWYSGWDGICWPWGPELDQYERSFNFLSKWQITKLVWIVVLLCEYTSKLHNVMCITHLKSNWIECPKYKCSDLIIMNVDVWIYFTVTLISELVGNDTATIDRLSAVYKSTSKITISIVFNKKMLLVTL